MAGIILPSEYTIKLPHTGQKAGMKSRVKTMLDYLASKGVLEASLSGDNGDSYEALDAQMNLLTPAAEGDGLLGLYKYYRNYELYHLLKWEGKEVLPCGA